MQIDKELAICGGFNNFCEIIERRYIEIHEPHLTHGSSVLDNSELMMLDCMSLLMIDFILTAEQSCLLKYFYLLWIYKGSIFTSKAPSMDTGFMYISVLPSFRSVLRGISQLPKDWSPQQRWSYYTKYIIL